jgi:hypothetical protein
MEVLLICLFCIMDYVVNDIASTKEQTLPTATASSHAIPTTLPTELAGITPERLIG